MLFRSTGANRVGAVFSGTTCTNGTSSDASPNCEILEIVSESFSSTTVYMNSQPYVYWTVTFHDPRGQLPDLMGARLCPPNATGPGTTYCTGAAMYRSGDATNATYVGLFGITYGAPSGPWGTYYFWPVGQEATTIGRGSATVNVTY